MQEWIPWALGALVGALTALTMKRRPTSQKILVAILATVAISFVLRSAGGR